MHSRRSTQYRFAILGSIALWLVLLSNSDAQPPPRRSERVAGKVLQGSYDRENNNYRRIDGPTNVPYEI